jgi:hypothetical protein
MRRLAMNRLVNRVVTAAAVAAFAVACSDADPAGPGGTPGNLQLSEIPADPTGDNTLTNELFEVCKFYTEGTGPDLVVQVAVDIGNDGSIDDTRNVTLKGTGVVGEACQEVWLHGGSSKDKVTVTEVTDLSATYTTTVARTYVLDGGPVQGPDTNMDGLVDGDSGVLLVLTNTLIPQGGEGCTPGYWKNHAGPDSFSNGGKKKPSSWEVYDPNDFFDATFGVVSSFGNTSTLIQALIRGGGGENALGRHAVAALLNSVHSGVSYDLSPAGVIGVVVDAYTPGGLYDFESAKNYLAGLNEQGCPL